MEDNRENQPLEQSAGAALQAAHTVRGALKAGKAAGGMAAGTAAGGPLGAVVGFVVSRKNFWRAAVTLFLLVILFPVIIVNLFGILLARGGMGDAESYVRQAKEAEVIQLKERILELGQEEPETFAALFEVLRKENEQRRMEIWEDYESNYAGLERYELELADEYETLFLPAYAEYLAVLFAENWSGSQIRSFLQKGTVDLYSTDLNSPYEEYFHLAEEIYGVDSALLKAVAKVESDFTPDVVSSAGAVGIMQLMPGTAQSLGVSDPYDPKQNILGGARYLADSLTIFGGYPDGMELAVASYHSGIAAVRRAGYRIPRASEDYVEKVMGYVDKSESGSLTPGREDQKEGSRKSMKMFLNEVYGRKEAMFSWTCGEIREEERTIQKWYQDGDEISEEEYRRLQKEGEDGLSEESFEENWYVVPYRIVTLLEAERKMFDTSYSYRQVTTPKRFLQALEMLKFLAENDDLEAFWETFGWKELVDGGDAYESSYDADIWTEGESIVYDTVPERTVSYYNQTEEPWAQVRFSGTTIRSSGCGPVCMAMVVSTLTGQTVTPAQVAEFTEESGLYVPGRGTSHSLPSMAAGHWGFSVRRVHKSRMEEVKYALQEGALAVVICKEYSITGSGSGHYIVLTGVTREGYFTIADPASRERSGRLYSVDTIRSYARDLEAGSIWLVSM
ncbi:MAG: transglycosylase SLT domain-containing protein [Eisenbergiella sp.]